MRVPHLMIGWPNHGRRGASHDAAGAGAHAGGARRRAGRGHRRRGAHRAGVRRGGHRQDLAGGSLHARAQAPARPACSGAPATPCTRRGRSGPCTTSPRRPAPALRERARRGAPRARIFSAVLEELRGAVRPSSSCSRTCTGRTRRRSTCSRSSAAASAQLPALLVLTYRDDELGPRHPLRVVLGDLRRRRRCAASRCRRSRPRRCARSPPASRSTPPALHRQTGGNPFFVTEALAQPARPASRRPCATPCSPAPRASRRRRAPRSTRPRSSAPRSSRGCSPGWSDDAAGASRNAWRSACSAPQGDRLPSGTSWPGRRSWTRSLPPRRRALHPLALRRDGRAPGGRAPTSRGSPITPRAPARPRRPGPRARRGRARAASRRAPRGRRAYARALRFAARSPAAERRGARGLRRRVLSGRRLDEAIARPARGARHLARGRRPAARGRSLRVNSRSRWSALPHAEAEAASRRPSPSWVAAAGHRRWPRLSHPVAPAHARPRPRRGRAWGRKAITLAERFGDADIAGAAYNDVGAAMPAYARRMRARASGAEPRPGPRGGRPERIVGRLRQSGLGLGEIYRFADADRYLPRASPTPPSATSTRQPLHAGVAALTRLYQGRWGEAGRRAPCANDPHVADHQPHHGAGRPSAACARGGAIRRGRRARRGARAGRAHRDAPAAGPVRAARAEAAWLAGRPTRALWPRPRAAWRPGASATATPGTRRARLLAPARRASAAPACLAAEPFALQIAGDWRRAARPVGAAGCPYERARALAEGDELQRAALAHFDRLGARPDGASALRQRLRARRRAPIPRGPRPARAATRGLHLARAEIAALLARALT